MKLVVRSSSQGASLGSWLPKSNPTDVRGVVLYSPWVSNYFAVLSPWRSPTAWAAPTQARCKTSCRS